MPNFSFVCYNHVISAFSLFAECSVLELYVHGVGGQDLRATLLKMEALPNEASLFPMWSNLLPLSVSILISQLYPFSDMRNYTCMFVMYAVVCTLTVHQMALCQLCGCMSVLTLFLPVYTPTGQCVSLHSHCIHAVEL